MKTKIILLCISFAVLIGWHFWHFQTVGISQEVSEKNEFTIQE